MTGYILTAIQSAIGGEAALLPEPMPGDKWLVASAMQKSIRRGEVHHATRAAYALWLQDRQSFWRRLHIISVEDVGIADVDAVVETLTATACSAWRRKVGDLRVGLFLVRRLCASHKTRIADEVLIQVERSGSFSALRNDFVQADNDTLAKYAADETRPLTERCLAIWYLAGMRQFPSELMPGRKGEPALAIELLKGLGAPAELVESSIAVMGRTQWPLSVFTPLIWQEAYKQKSSTKVCHQAIEPTPEVNGVPVYAADMFTRSGQASFRALQKEVKSLRPFSVRQIGLAVFYREGGLLDKKLTSPFFDDYGQAAEIADFGLPVPEYMGLREILNEQAQKLNAIRTHQLERSLYGVEPDLLNRVKV